MAEHIDITDNPERSEYVISVGGTLAGVAEYRDRPHGRRVFTHTEVDPSFEGHGLGGKLIGAALADVRSRGLKAVPLCPFVTKYISSHPEFDDIVDAEALAEFTAESP